VSPAEPTSPDRRTPGADKRERNELSEREAWAVLASVEGLGPAGLGAILTRFNGGLGTLAAASTARGRSTLIRAATAADGRERFDADVAASIARLAADPWPAVDELEAAQIDVMTTDDNDYPVRLRRTEHPPPILFLRGDRAALSADRSVAIVGTRRPTEAGRRTAARIAAATSRLGAVVVSGLAVGIDGAAHAAVVAEHGRTVAVLGSGHDRLVPRAHLRLAAAIVANGGAIVSEFWPTFPPKPWTFPRRNRVISGLADASVIVEAPMRSGALYTAEHALKQGRDCFFVPGSIDEPNARGCLAWLREHPSEARIVAGIPELVEDLGLTGEASPDTPRARRSLEAELVEVGATAAMVARELVAGRSTLDELVATTGHEPATILGALTLLELRDLATSTYGRYRPAGRLASAEPDRRGANGPVRLPVQREPC
jgi:DNA processing protein